MVGIVTQLVGLILPIQCAGCGAPDIGLCRRCEAKFSSVRRCESRAGRLDRLDGMPVTPVWCAADYEGTVRRAVVNWKDRGHTGAGRAFGEALYRVALAPEVGETVDRCRAEVFIVAVPTTGAAKRRRGGDLVSGLAYEVAAGLQSTGRVVSLMPLLRRRAHRDSVGLGTRDRSVVQSGFSVRRGEGRRLIGRSVVLVDDVLTTGATLAACAQVVERAGGYVIGACVLASTPPPGRYELAGN